MSARTVGSRSVSWFVWPGVLRLASGVVARRLPPLALLVVGIGGCGEEPICTLVGCSTATMMYMPVQLSYDDLAGHSVVACRNQTDCFVGTLTGLGNSASDAREGRTLPLSVTPKSDSPVDSHVSMELQTKPGPFLLVVTFGASRAQDGDDYSLELRDSADALVSRVEGVVPSSLLYYPNGEQCPGGPCYQFVVGEAP